MSKILGEAQRGPRVKHRRCSVSVLVIVALRHVVGPRVRERQAVCTSHAGRFETETLTARKNLKALIDLPGTWIDRVRQHRPLDKLILDLDSLMSEGCDRHEGPAYERSGSPGRGLTVPSKATPRRLPAPVGSYCYAAHYSFSRAAFISATFSGFALVII